MRKSSLFTVIIGASLLFACKSTPDSDKAATSDAKEVTDNADGTTYKVDAGTSMIKWIGTKVSGHHVGVIKISDGSIHVKDGAVTGGKITMDMKSLEVTGPKDSNSEGNKKLEGHLTSADFFEVEKYPEATFEITAVTPYTEPVSEENDPRQDEINVYKVTNPTHKVSGNLTMKGITKNIEFPAKITTTDNGAEAVAKFNIDRTQWNITYPGKPDDLIKNDVHLGILLKASK